MLLIPLSFGLLLWLLASTSYFPKYLVSKIEQENEVLQFSDLDTNLEYFILVLAAGYEYDSKLPATGQLNLVTLGRLNEALRISRHLDRFILVTSGCTFYKTKSQAQVTKNAAEELGIDGSRIETLETPSSTLEEAKAFISRFGKVSNLILVTDALHMPRALTIFNSHEIFPIAAPANFKVKSGVNSYNGFTLPKLKSLILLRLWLFEKIKSIKFNFSK